MRRECLGPNSREFSHLKFNRGRSNYKKENNMPRSSETLGECDAKKKKKCFKKEEVVHCMKLH